MRPAPPLLPANRHIQRRCMTRGTRENFGTTLARTRARNLPRRPPLLLLLLLLLSSLGERRERRAAGGTINGGKFSTRWKTSAVTCRARISPPPSPVTRRSRWSRLCRRYTLDDGESASAIMRRDTRSLIENLSSSSGRASSVDALERPFHGKRKRLRARSRVSPQNAN